jgi:hypothetical protein
LLPEGVRIVAGNLLPFDCQWQDLLQQWVEQVAFTHLCDETARYQQRKLSISGCDGRQRVTGQLQESAELGDVANGGA